MAQPRGHRRLSSSLFQAWFAVAAVVLPAVGCGRAAPEVPETPARVVTLAPNLTEIVFAAGAEEMLVAVTTADDHPRQVERIPKVGAFPLNHEAIVARDPDLVLATGQVNNAEDVEPLVQLGIPVVFFEFSGVDDVIGAVREVGDLLGTAAVAGATADSLADRWAHLKESTSGFASRPKLLLLIRHEVLYSFGSESYTEEMVAASGAESVTARLSGQSSVLSDEFVLSSAPDIIVFTSDSTVTGEQILDHHPSWDALPALVTGEIHTVDPDLVLRPGPRVIEGTERLAEIVARWLERTD